ncbi:MAG: hypothetical protein OEV42_08010 [Deltaproteobacteria bacterium]|nr:hypothetical protein [Deltaproteobacteria bacterium]
MSEIYEAAGEGLEGSVKNNSGGGKDIELPEGVSGWSWGAFLLNWIWAIGNSTWIGLLAILPYVGLIFSIVLGFKGREWAWRNKRWDSFEHFEAVQKRWSFWGVLIIVGIGGLGILSAILIPALHEYRMSAGGS